MPNQYQKDIEKYIDKATQKPSFRKHLKDKGFINNDNDNDAEPFSNFNDFLNRKNKDND